MRKKGRVLVTGGAGFIGSEVVRQLIEKDYSVIVADNLSKNNVTISSKCKFFKIDLTNKKQTLKIFENVDFCIHAAAKIGGIGYFHKYPATILSENNKMYSSIFEASVVHRIKKIVYLSSSMVFESTRTYPSKEKDIFKIPPPVSSYGFSKLIGEWYCYAFQREYGLDYTILRPFNAYGINERPEEDVGYAHVIPDLIKKILLGQYPLEILGSGNQTRCFTHVSDIARGVIMAMESKEAINQDFNIGSEKEVKILEIAKLIWILCAKKNKFRVKMLQPFEYDIKRRFPSSAKARKILRWKAEKKLELELPRIIEWIKNLLGSNHNFP